MRARLTRIGDCVDPVSTWNPASKPEEDFVYIDLSSVSQSEKRIVSKASILGSKAPSRARQLVNSGDILVSTVRPNLNGVAAVTAEFDGAIASTGFCVLRPRPSRLSSRYLLYWVQSPRFVEQLTRQATGASYPAVTDRIVKNSQIWLPSSDEQRRVVAILDRVNELRRKRRRTLRLLDSAVQSLFLDAFGDPAANTRRFPVKSFGEIGKLERGVSKHRPRNDPILLGGPYPLIQTGDVTNSGGYIRNYYSTYSEVGLKQSKLWPAGTLCITIAANIAETGILTFPACFPDSVVGFTHENAEMVQFVKVWLSFLRATLERTAPAVAQKNINLEILRNLKVVSPPLELVMSFGDKMELLRRFEQTAQRAEAQSEELFSSLQNRAFSHQL